MAMRRIVFAAHFGQVGGEVRIETDTAGIERGILFFGGVEHLFDGHLVALPVGAQIPLIYWMAKPSV
jgi:UDP-N-acetylmuramyl pentapeptide synthase